MDQFKLAITVMATTDSHWGPRDAEGRRRAFTAEELDALVDFGWHWPDLKAARAACANALRSLWQPRGCNNVASPRSLAPPSILNWTERRGIQMTTSLRTRIKIPTLSAVLLFAVAAPIVVHAEDEVLVEEPVLVAQDQDPALGPAVLSWDERSGYGSVEHTRADVSSLWSGEVSPGHEQALAFAAAAAATLWDATSGYGSVEASRAANAMDVRWVPARAIVDQALALGAAAAAWDDTSGYGAVEASRAANALPAPPASFTSQVSPDVRWAPAPAIAPMAPVETSHATNPDYIPAALASGQRAESAHLAVVLLPGEDAVGVRRTQR